MLLDEVATYLNTNVAALTLGTNLFIGRMLETPDICVALHESAAGAPLEALGGDGTPILERPRVQVHVRNTTYSAGRTMAQDIWASLVLIAGDTLSGTLYLRAQPIDSPTFLLRDENDRVVFNMNFELWKELS